MRYSILSILIILGLLSCKVDSKTNATSDAKPDAPKVEYVAYIQGQQLTGVTVSQSRLFTNFPRWRDPLQFSVAEIQKDNQFVAYPNKAWNAWQLGDTVTDSVFVAVQSVVASNDKLYVVDTRNPGFKGVIGAPMIFVFDLKTNTISNRYSLPEGTYHPHSYINDVRIDEAQGYAFFTDSGAPGLVVLNLKNGKAKRVLDGHVSTTATQDHLTIDGKKWSNTVHSDGIALDTKNGLLYYHALTGYELYAVPTNILISGDETAIENAVVKVAKTAAPDGMIVYDNTLIYADLEQHKILQMNLETKDVKVIVEGAIVKWADSFSIENDVLYYTNSRIHEANASISELDFSIYKLPLK